MNNIVSISDYIKVMNKRFRKITNPDLRKTLMVGDYIVGYVTDEDFERTLIHIYNGEWYVTHTNMNGVTELYEKISK